MIAFMNSFNKIRSYAKNKKNLFKAQKKCSLM